MLGLRYDSDAARRVAADAMCSVKEAAYWASIELAREKGAFPLFDRDRYLATPFVRALPPELRADIAATESATAISPRSRRRARSACWPATCRAAWNRSTRCRTSAASGRPTARSRACRSNATRWPSTLALRGRDEPLPEAFVTVDQVGPDAQLEMQAALQVHVDNAIAKTVNVRADIPFDEFAATYRRAYALGLKGCTVYRPNVVTGAVLSALPTAERCCDLPGAD